MDMDEGIATRVQVAPRTGIVPAPRAAARGETPHRTAVLARFGPICLQEMGHVALLRRTDTKFVLGEAQLLAALGALTGCYRALEIEGRRWHRYRTLYFDTPDLALYQQHHNGWRDRYKVRTRAYTDTGLAFLEVKHKVNAGITLKSRVRTPKLSLHIARETEPFLRTHYPYRVEALEPRLYNTFERATLVSRWGVERVTVDLGLRFWCDGADVSLDAIAIAEVKQDGYANGSPFVQQMRALGVRATPFSKYCIGVCMLYPQVKHNQFMPQLRRIARLSCEGRTA